jgi:hypothetical protein
MNASHSYTSADEWPPLSEQDEVTLVDQLFPSTVWRIGGPSSVEPAVAPTLPSRGSIESLLEATGVRLTAIGLAIDEVPREPSLAAAAMTLAERVADVWRVVDAIAALYADTREPGGAWLCPADGHLERYLDGAAAFGQRVAFVLTDVATGLRGLHVDWDDLRSALRSAYADKALPSVRAVRLDLALLPVDGSRRHDLACAIVARAEALFAAVEMLEVNLARRFG